MELESQRSVTPRLVSKSIRRCWDDSTATSDAAEMESAGPAFPHAGHDSRCRAFAVSGGAQSARRLLTTSCPRREPSLQAV